MTILNGAGHTPPRKPFHVLLQEARVADRLTVHEIAKNAGISEATYREWESGVSAPTRVQLRRMRHAIRLEPQLPTPTPPATVMGQAFARAGVVAVASPTPVVEPVPPAPIVEVKPPAPPPPAEPADAPNNGRGWRAFGVALRSERQREGLIQSALGDILGVHGTTVGQWEGGDIHPLRKHYDALVALLPRLAEVHVSTADMKGWEKPGRAAGATASAPALLPAPAPTAAPAAGGGDPLSAIDRVILAYDALGQPIDLTHTRADGVVTARLVAAEGGEVVAEGAGPSLTAAARAMLDALLSGLEARQESTRRVVEQAGARLAAYGRAVEAVRGAVSPGGAGGTAR